MDPLLSYSINKFFLLLIPKDFLTVLPPAVTAFLVTVVPYTPIDAIVFTLTFLFIYIVNPFGLANRKEYFCRFNKPEQRVKVHFWTALKSSYVLYFMLMFVINLNTASTFKSHSLQSIGASFN
jgi:hypothetical protein